VEGRFMGDLAGRFAPDDLGLEGLKPRGRQQIRFPLFLYRAIVVVGLPLFLLIYGVAKLLQWTRILASVGKLLERLLQVWLGGIMGDVVSYAMDSAKAARIRSTVERELHFFHERDEVKHVHVVAHSQGTAITFELLFRHLDPAYLERIRTYLTLGSVLSYYHHADAVLDPHHYDQRFPPARFPEPDDFAPGFRWYNCWNLTDPITEFYGLDEFLLPRAGAHAESPLVLPDLSQEDLDDLHPLSPTNIKTPASLRHHSDYWTNQEWVQRPLARRLLGKPERWKQARRVPNAKNRFGHARLIFVLHSLAVALIFYYFVDAFIEPFQGAYLAGLSLIGGPGGETTRATGLVGGLLQEAQTGLKLLGDPRWQEARTQMILYGMLLVPLTSWIGLGWAALRTFLFSRGRSVG
jgi:pimeloyl-ACP methyl ester carboxylesterase